MKITEVIIGRIKIPLIRPFITALRTTDHVEDILVMIKTNLGNIGYGSVASTPAITGDFTEGIVYAIHKFIAPKLINKEPKNLESLLDLVNHAIVNNNSAKCAITTALYDLHAQLLNQPLYKLFQQDTSASQSSHTNCTYQKVTKSCSNEVNEPIQLNTCITISVKDPEQMAQDANEFVTQGFKCLKVKLGINHEEDIKRIKAIRHAVGNDITIIADANQAWQADEAIRIINQLKELNIGFIEQPVNKYDLEGLSLIQQSVPNTIIADESCMNFEDAKVLCKMKATQALNIKLAKCGGLHQAQKIYQLANINGLKCMVGSMLESPIGIAAMAHFAVSKPDLIATDLDSLALIRQNPIIGGVTLKGTKILLNQDAGIGINSIHSSAIEILSNRLPVIS
jgi:L-Ala-D/L-Glu epimerase